MCGRWSTSRTTRPRSRARNWSSKEGLPTLRLQDGDGDGVYTGLYTGFDQMSIYRIVVYATDEDGQLSRPRELTVTTGWTVFLPGVAR